MKCNICGTETIEFDRSCILNKYTIQYYRCPQCGFIQTEKPYWLDEAYTDAITDLDIGLLWRNVYISDYVAGILNTWFPTMGKGLDYGAGYGTFVRMVRDKGFNFYWYDKYCKNIFAKGFERKTDEHYDVVTAFELFEHFDDPMAEIQNLLMLGDTVIFSTTLLPDKPPKIQDWWYYVPEAGQHISFYSKEAMQYIAKYYDKQYTGFQDIHILSGKKISRRKLVLIYYVTKYLPKFFQRKSLLAQDYAVLTGKKID